MSHLVDFYDDDPEMVSALATYVLEGLARHETVVVVATGAHRRGTDAALMAAGADPAAARALGHYVALDAEETLRTFMVAGAPHADAFASHLGGVVAGALTLGRPVRIYGEMVTLLWQDGNVPAAIALETLWNELQAELAFTLLCSYPSQVLQESWLADLRRICELHSQVEPPASYAGTGLLGCDEHGDVGCSRVFLPAPQAVPAVRRFVSGVLHAWDQEQRLTPGPEVDADRAIADTVLACSEMATNAVLHAHSPFLLTLKRYSGGVLVAVEDAAGGNAKRQSAAPTALGGRGLTIVQAVADRWGCEPLAHGKVVWAEVPAHPADLPARAV